MRKWIFGPTAAFVLLTLFAPGASAQGHKWHPGHYVMLTGDTSVYQHLKQIDEIGRDGSIKGVMVRIWWHDLETSWGRYDFSRINRYLQRLRQQPTTKRLVVRVMDRAFHERSPSGIVPNYLRNNSQFNGGVIRTKNGYAARLWERRVMDRLIALYRQIGHRYDSEPLFEGVFTEESTLGLRWVPAGYSNQKLVQQYIRFMNQVKPAFTRTNLFMNVNWIGSSSLMGDLVQAMVWPGIAAAGSDLVPGEKTLGQQVLTGIYGADYRRELPIASAVETASLGGSLGDFTPRQIANAAYNDMQAHYLFWVRNTWKGDRAQRWYTGILPFLRTNPPVRTRCPNSYGICVN
jgi:hypothetical protein